ncbi:MAG: sigma-54 dependent transcriptional regulator [Methylotenera sp.]|nr:sigma-54 dependent transcriptional regulator [Methylotenera sp.]MDO9232609.1 sigma-54 dependent transcriptional regulator [Methylotenera sp.]MDO9388582.1 sigma-54 dependent transcriptional regulator [Methylotenera sp.]MDP2101549.1 sigma-54 dependent transcriptional regulator [Methylotenera sp.]MDP2280657.1 sigma-54 dependent transcriptional regulator [Methylotenera sp.]
MASKHILVVDDEIGIRELLSDILHDEGYRVDLAENAATARALRLQERPDVVLLDIWMPDCDGISLLKEWANAGLLTMPVVMMSGHGTIDTAVEATRIGAFDFLEKPIALQKLLKTVAAALKHSEQLPKSEMSLANLGKSPIILLLKERLDKIATSANDSPSPVLFIGPKGGGAELCARFLQNVDTPWRQLTELGELVNAPLDILEQGREGVVYIAEIAELNKTEQKGLLLLITKADKYNVRVVCGTSQNLPKLQAEGLFDHNLLQILSAVSLRIPALEEHKEDIPEMAMAIASLQFELADIPYREFDIAALNALRNASWPGDLAQLDAVVRNLIQTSLGEKITLDDVKRVLHQFDDATQVDAKVKSVEILSSTDTNAEGLTHYNQPLREARDDFERRYFAHHIKNVTGNMSKLAEIAGLERTHLYRKLKQLDIKIKG